MKKLKDFDLKSKTVILRCDLNVTIKDGKILSEERIIASLPTINYLIKNSAKIIIMSHLGKIKTKEDKEKNSLYPVYERLSELLDTNVYFSSATSGKILESKIKKLNSKDVLLMENTRYEDLIDQKESKCNLELSQYWASLGDIFIDDAFGISHRKHASNYGISKFLPSGIGLLMEQEINGLKKIVVPAHPFIVIMSGAKVEDKLNIIDNLLPKCDYLLVGGGIANSFLGINHNIGASLTNREKYNDLKKLLIKYPEKIILPTDVKVLNKDKVYITKINKIEDEDIIYDLGDETIKKYGEYINKAKTILLNGTVGYYEDKRFARGTEEILKMVSSSKAWTTVGGGDALSSLEQFNIKDFDFISTGGGATLEYISTGKVNSLEE